MFDIVLYQPEIPPNTGNLIRLAANTGCRLHLVKPLGFDLSDKQLARAGLDYHDMASVTEHDDWETVRTTLAGRRWFVFSTRATLLYASAAFRPDDVLLFGRETSGLPDAIHAQFDDAQRLRLPMQPGSRSMNLANSVSVVVFEAWRQNGFVGGR
jgi:tRNA (cytidine/uridine-2'-O-)-methyltransferase